MDRLERVQYYPGQRLLAADLNDQDSYEIRLRRMLNSGLFSSGVVMGLEVAQVIGSTKKLIVKSGLALDPLGREVYLANDAEITVPNQPPVTATGYYLFVRYRETSVTGRSVDCLPSTVAPPARYRIDPIIDFTDLYPDPKICKSGKDDFNCGVVLALVRLNDSCEIGSIETNFRQFSYPTHMSQVTAMALEGEKDLNPANPKRLRFHIRGGAPNAVLLYIRGAQFSNLYYTELGSHAHSLTVGDAQTQPQTADISHGHSVQQFSTDADGDHGHRVYASPLVYAVGNLSLAGNHYRSQTDKILDGPRIDLIEAAGTHQHTVQARSTEGATPNASGPHQHSVLGSTANTDSSGVSSPARGGTPLSYLTHLNVKLDNKDITNTLLEMLGWAALGEGGSGDLINKSEGTGSIDLLRLPGISLEIGPHELLFSVDEGGGKLLYNLYIE